MVYAIKCTLPRLGLTIKALSLFMLLAISFFNKSSAIEIGVRTEVATSSINAARVNEPTETKVIHKIDEMDVYKLAPHAYLLRFGHMFSLQGYEHIFKAKAQLKDLIPAIKNASLKTSVEPALIAAVILVESSAVQDAVSTKGAQGLMQLMPETAKELQVKDPFDAHENVSAGSSYLQKQLMSFSTIEEALAAYNAGPGNVIKFKGIPPFKETKEFVGKVLSTYYKLQKDQAFNAMLQAQ